MPTVTEYALLSKSVYKPDDKDLIAPDTKNVWRLDGEPTNVTSIVTSFQAAVYVNKNKEESVLAFKGSEDWQDFVVDDLMISQGSYPATASLADSMAKSKKEKYKNLSLTGHSLGGALAIIAAGMNGLKACTFNAPGMLQECLRYHMREQLLDLNPSLLKFMKTAAQLAFGSEDIRNYRMENDVVSLGLITGFQVGTTTMLRKKGIATYDVEKNHSMDTMYEVISTTKRGASGTW